MDELTNALLAAAVDVRARADADMRAARAVLQAIERNRVVLHFQPIASALDASGVLYHECLARIIDDKGGGLEYPGRFIPSLERLGLMYWLDRHVVRLVVDLLKVNPDLTLGSNVSAQSAFEDVWWEPLFVELSSAPEVAQRLVIEITETAGLDVAGGRAFMRRLQQLGCRVAIDDFGAGRGVETGLLLGTPDIVKITGDVLKRQNDIPNGERRLASLISLAQEIAPCVVVEGIESAELLHAARRAGGRWVQGYYTGAPRSFDLRPLMEFDSLDLPVVQEQAALSSFLRLPERVLDALRAETSAPAGDFVEHAMALFDLNACAIVEEHVCERMRNPARLAYTAGLASSIYGKYAAVSAPLRGELAAALRAERCVSANRFRLLRSIAAFGRLHGELLAGSRDAMGQGSPGGPAA